MIFKKKDKFAPWLEKNQGGSFTQFYPERPRLFTGKARAKLEKLSAKSWMHDGLMCKTWSRPAA